MINNTFHQFTAQNSPKLLILSHISPPSTAYHNPTTSYNVSSVITLGAQQEGNTAPSCEVNNTNITVAEDSGSWYLDANMSENVNISCFDADSDSLTYTCAGDGFTNPNNDDLLFTSVANGTGTYQGNCSVSDGTETTDVAFNVVVTAVNDGPWWDIIGNATATSIDSGGGYQSIGVNASSYAWDVEIGQGWGGAGTNITIQTNESGVDCTMPGTPTGNFSIFCNPGSVPVTIVTLTADDGTNSANESFLFQAQNNSVWWDLIGNDTAANISYNFGTQPLGINASFYFRSALYDRAPRNITATTNESGVDCFMNTVSNFSLFCTPSGGFLGRYIVTLNGSDYNNPPRTAFENFEGIILNSAPTLPASVLPENNHLNDTTVVNLSCGDSTDADGDPIVYDYWNTTTTGTILNSICHNDDSECLWDLEAAGQMNEWNYWVCNANDTFASSSYTTVRRIRTETWDVINLSQFNYAENGLYIEGEQVFFDMNVSWNEIRYKEINTVLNFSNVTYTPTKTQYNNFTNYRTSLTIPSIRSTETFGWTWIVNLTYHNDSIFSNDSYGGSFDATEIFVSENCITNTTDVAIFNFSFWNEQTMSEIDFYYHTAENSSPRVDLSYNLSIYLSDADINVEVSNFTRNITAYWLCMPADRSYRITGLMEYSIPDYVTKHYYFLGDLWDNQTDEIPLLMNTPYGADNLQGANEIQPTLSDCDGNPLEGYWLFRKNDLFNKTLRHSDTGYQSPGDKASVFLQYLHTVYDIRFRKPDGQYVSISQASEPRTINSLTPLWNQDCEIPDWQSFDEIQTQLVWNGDTFELETVIPSGKSINFSVKSIGNSSDVVCETTEITTSGSYECNLTQEGFEGVAGEYFATVIAKDNNNYYLLINSLAQTVWDTAARAIREKIGSEGIVAAYMLSGTLALGGAAISPVIGLILLGVSLIALGFMQVIYFPFSMIILMCFILGWGIYKLRR